MAAPGGARARARAALIDDIKAAARRQLDEVGAAGLSLRAIARELGLVSSALYRYYASRDELLTALIIDAYDTVGDVAERAVPARGEFATRWLALARAIRGWALANPNDYALVYGSPVPGYRAPTDTVPAAQRVPFVALRLLAEGVAAGELTSDPTARIPRAVRSDLHTLREAAPGAPADVLSRGLAAWTQLFGTISFELFGHFHNVIDDLDAFFDHQMREAARRVVHGP
jgi:AcrR family transcriptional regulator